MTHPSLLGEEDEFDRAFQRLTSEPPESASIRLALPDEELEHLEGMARELAGDDEHWERAIYRCVRRVYVSEG